ncbi:MAG TPA: hemerythrin domain-containing protein, partial [Flavisolibacter sp.]|nr:hemerythrin domain-containing protein [Flavisolibacter sp.]
NGNNIPGETGYDPFRRSQAVLPLKLKNDPMAPRPIKRSEYLVQLSRDHHVTLLFCWKIRQAIQGKIAAGRIKDYVQYFWQHHMEPHFQEEERYVFVLDDDEKVEQARTEHVQIREQVERVLGASGEEALPLLSHLVNAVDNHVRFEERVLFPYLEQQLSEAQLKDIGDQFLQSPDLPDNYPDAFWKKG